MKNIVPNSISNSFYQSPCSTLIPVRCTLVYFNFVNFWYLISKTDFHASREASGLVFFRRIPGCGSSLLSFCSPPLVHPLLMRGPRQKCAPLFVKPNPYFEILKCNLIFSVFYPFALFFLSFHSQTKMCLRVRFHLSATRHTLVAYHRKNNPKTNDRHRC